MADMGQRKTKELKDIERHSGRSGEKATIKFYFRIMSWEDFI